MRGLPSQRESMTTRNRRRVSRASTSRPPPTYIKASAIRNAACTGNGRPTSNRVPRGTFNRWPANKPLLVYGDLARSLAQGLFSPVIGKHSPGTKRHFALSRFGDTRHTTTAIADETSRRSRPGGLGSRESRDLLVAISTTMRYIPSRIPGCLQKPEGFNVKKVFGSRSLRGLYKSLSVSRSNGGEL